MEAAAVGEPEVEAAVVGELGAEVAAGPAAGVAVGAGAELEHAATDNNRAAITRRDGSPLFIGEISSGG